MYKSLMKKAKSNKGFTLIELIVVIAIIAILALILVPRFAGFTDSAEEKTNEGNRRTIETATQVMIADGRLRITSSATSGSFIVTGSPTNVSGITSLSYTAPAAGPTDLQAALRALVGTNVKVAGDIDGYKVTVNQDGVTVTNYTAPAP
jgi:prepilin-type N-terminal cleavage/methylation domain-containing protein